MRNSLRLLPLLALPFLGCDDAEVVNEVGEGLVIGEGLFEEIDDVDDFTAAPDPSAAGFCDDVTDSNWQLAWRNLETAVITEVNKRRAAGAKCGGVTKAATTALTLDTKLRCAARKHSKDMGVNNFFSHTGSNGSTFVQRINAALYTWTRAAENIAAGQTTAVNVVNGWMNSTGHCNNIMDPQLKHIGVGYYFNSAATYDHYWTQDFGKP